MEYGEALIRATDPVRPSPTEVAVRKAARALAGSRTDGVSGGASRVEGAGSPAAETGQAASAATPTARTGHVVSPSEDWGVRRRARGGWLRRALYEVGPGPAVAIIGATIGAIALLTFRVAGQATGIFHAFYIPIVVAANRFRWRGAVAAGVISGLLAGPLRPVNDDAGPAQETWAWVFRLLMFILIGLMAAWFSRESSSSLAALIREYGDARSLRQALKHEELHAHYQPIADLRTDGVVGFEALCRWTHAVDGPIPPAEFIPLAERTGVVVPLGRYMLGRAAAQAAAWHASGAGHLMVTVNVSAEQLSRADLMDDVAAALDASGLPPSAMCLEITETALIKDPVAAMVNMRAARDLGLLVALDDFGTGHSSLAYLKDFPVDIIKIDKSFVDNVDVDPNASALVLAIIELAHALGATTVAEGIERPSQLNSLRLLGCDKGQGYLLGRPGPPDAATW